MEVGNLVYVRVEDDEEISRGYLLEILEVLPEGYFVRVMEGPHIGAEHYVRAHTIEPIWARRRITSPRDTY